MSREFIWFFVGLGIIVFLKYGKGSLSGLSLRGTLNSFVRPGGAVSYWWTSRGDEGRKFMWYVAVIILAYIVARIAPEGEGLIWRGVVALIGVHLIWTFMSSGKINVLSWTIVGGMLIYFVLAWGYPDDVPRIFDASWGLSKKVVHSAANKVESANTDYDNPPLASQATQQAQLELKHFDLSSDQIGPFRPLPTGGRMTYGCTSPGSEMMIEFDSTKSTLVKPGQWFSCPTPDRPVHIGDMYVNLRMYFRSSDGGKVYLLGVI